MNNKYIFLITLLLQIMDSTSFAQVYTPNGTAVDYKVYSAGNVAQFENEAAIFLQQMGWTNSVTKTAPATGVYNCHAYAWNNSGNYWINAFTNSDLSSFNPYSSTANPPTPKNITKYWNDGSYVEVPESYATKVWYGSCWTWSSYLGWEDWCDHSAVKLPSGLYESKWGAWGRYIHPADKSPYNTSNRRYFIRNIIGSDFVCSTSTYTLNIQSGQLVTWSLTPSDPSNSIFTLIPNGSQAYVTVPNKTDNPQQWATLKATLSNGVIIEKLIRSCAIAGPETICYIVGHEYYFTKPDTTATWSVTSGFSIIKNPNGHGNFTAHVTPAPFTGQTGTITAVVDGKTYTKAIKADFPSISGPNEICNSGTFAIVYGYSATNWSASSGFSVSATTGNSVTVTADPNAGAGTITAVVNGITLTKNITKCGYVPLSILGPDVILTSSTATYSLNTGQSASWNVQPSMSFTYTVNGGGASVTVKPTALSGGGGGTVIASVGGDNTATKPILICGIHGPDYICGTAKYTLSNSPHLYTWALGPPGFTILSSDSTSITLQTNMINGEPGVVIAVFGPLGSVTKNITASCGKGGSPGSYISAYPNLVNDILYIEIDAGIAQNLLPFNASLIFDVLLYDWQGNLLRQKKTKGGTVQFNVSNLPDGMYYLHVYDGVNTTPEMIQIVVEH